MLLHSVKHAYTLTRTTILVIMREQAPGGQSRPSHDNARHVSPRFMGLGPQGGRQVAELLMGVPAPVMYWEQGHEWVFGDEIRFQVGRPLACDRALSPMTGRA